MKLDNYYFKKWMQVQAYKHDGSLHRQWSPAYLVEETEDYWALASRASSVVESNGRKWITKENAIFLLFKKEWMNVIAMFKKDIGITYYVNIATPTILDGEYLKYIDYDLDIKKYPDHCEILDEKEYQRNIKLYNYPYKLKEAIDASMKRVLSLIETKSFPFKDKEIEDLYNMFISNTKPSI